MKQIFYLIFPVLFAACGHTIPEGRLIDADPPITPDYLNITIPPNIAPLYFALTDSIKEAYAIFTAKSRIVTVKAKNGQFKISEKKWRDLLQNSIGQKISVKITLINNCKEILQYRPFELQVTEEKIDPYIAYRLIEPGYELWNKMGIYQRCLENFDETPVLLNTLTNENCMNCHTFCQHSPDKMLFHLRGIHGGTIFADHGKLKKINTQASWMVKAGVYPRWHPDGKYVVFSTNNTSQEFLAMHTNKIEVFDFKSDLAIYDTEQDKIFSYDILRSDSSYETFPEWSPDGCWLYFCTAPALDMPIEYKDLKYSLVRVPFNPSDGSVGNAVDTLFSAEKTGKSTSLPRISPDGKYLAFCLFDYGTFPIWHRENDLYQINLETMETIPMTDANSDDTDSYHCWSSNGRWMIFSSRRLDKNCTRLYISYFDETGHAHTPILLPQKTSDYYDYLMQSYNIPELISKKISISPYVFAAAAKKEAVKVKE